MSLKNPVTPPGINPGTVRLVAQCLNHYATPGPYQDFALSKLFSGDIRVQLFTHLCHLNDIYSGIKLCYYLVLVYVSAATTV